MTELEFINACMVSPQFYLQSGEEISKLAHRALQAAKEAGAKFDPEPDPEPGAVELPLLRAFRFAISFSKPTPEHATVHKVNAMGRDEYLSPAEAAEVIRRCEVVSTLRELLCDPHKLKMALGSSHIAITPSDRAGLLNIINGKSNV